MYLRVMCAAASVKIKIDSVYPNRRLIDKLKFQLKIPQKSQFIPTGKLDIPYPTYPHSLMSLLKYPLSQAVQVIAR